MRYPVISAVISFLLLGCADPPHFATTLLPYAKGHIDLDSVRGQRSNFMLHDICYGRVLLYSFGENPDERNDSFMVIDLHTKERIAALKNQYIFYALEQACLSDNKFYFAKSTSLPSYYEYDCNTKKLRFINHAYIDSIYRVDGGTFEKRNNQLFVFASPYGIYAINEKKLTVTPAMHQGFVDGTYSTITYPLHDTVDFICGYTENFTGDSVTGYCINRDNAILWQYPFKKYDRISESFFKAMSFNDRYVFVNSRELFALQKKDANVLWKTRLDMMPAGVFLYDSCLVAWGWVAEKAGISIYNLHNGEKLATRYFEAVEGGYSCGLLSGRILFSANKVLYAFASNDLRELFRNKYEEAPYLQMFFDKYTNQPFLLVDEHLFW